MFSKCKMIRGEWKPRGLLTALKDTLATEENLQKLLKKRAFSRRMPPEMKLGIDYKCAHIIEKLEANKEFFETPKDKLKKLWKEIKHEPTSKNH